MPLWYSPLWCSSLLGFCFFDSSKVESKRNRTVLTRSIGFFLLSFVYITYATTFDFDIAAINLVTRIIKIIGLVLILVSLTKEPILKKPVAAFLLPALSLGALTYALTPLSAVLTLYISFVYLRKTTEGLERQLKPASFAFLFLGIAELVKIAFFASATTNVYFSKLLSQFGAVWNIVDILTLIGIAILGVWAWGYIRFRLEIQVFVVTVARTIMTFLVVTFFFTFLLLNNLQSDALSHLETDLKVIGYAIDGLKGKTLAYAQTVAQDGHVKQAFLDNNLSELYSLTDEYMASQKVNSLVIATASGQVLVRGENKGLANDNVSSDPIVQAAITGKNVSAIAYSDSTVVPEISVDSAVPIVSGDTGEPIGTVTIGLSIDNAFVDGIKSVTGLDTSIFGGNVRSATTFVASDGKSRFTGTLEANTAVTDNVLKAGQNYLGTENIFNRPYYVVYSPLKTYDDKVVGMIFTGKPQDELTDTANKSIEYTFLGSSILMIVSIIPAYFVSRYMRRNMEA